MSKILMRRGSAANWTSVNPVLDPGEFGYESDTGNAKIGDGVTTWDLLPYSLLAGFSTILATKVSGSSVGQPDGVASLDSGGKVPATQLPSHASTHGSAGSDPVTVAQSQVTNLATDLSAKAPLASPTFTGTPAAPTAAADTNTTQVATTAFVVGQAASATPNMDGSAAVGTSLKFARQDHVHASDTSKSDVAPAQNTQTGTGANAYTFVLADAGRLTMANCASAATFTVPPQSSVAWTGNSIIKVTSIGAGVITIAGGVGVTVTNASATLAQFQSVALVRTGQDAWTVVPFAGGAGKATYSTTTGSPTVTTVGGKTCVQFTGSGSITISKPGTVTAFIVPGGAGGGAGNGYGGGGGAGRGYETEVYLIAGVYPVTVGGGGAGAYDAVGGTGGASSISNLSSSGGGGGSKVAAIAGVTGGCGGGGANNGVGGSANALNPWPGNAGGNGSASAGGGGGGVGSAGAAGVSGAGGNGGSGLTSSITGTAVTYCGGGGGGGATSGGTSSTGGTGGLNGVGASGTANRGGGGGGGGGNFLAGGNGGSGIVVLLFG